MTDLAVAAQLRRRRSAARRLPPFDDAGHRDDLDLLADEVRGLVPWLPFGLTEEQRRNHANRLVTQYGWTLEEVEQVLGVRPRTGVAA